MSRFFNMFLPVDQRKVVGSTFCAKYIHVMDETKCNRLYSSQKKVKMVEGVVVNVEQKLLIKSGSNSMLFLTTKRLMEVSRGLGYILSMWLQNHF